MISNFVDNLSAGVNLAAATTPTSGFNLLTLFSNASTYAKVAGSAFLVLVGVICLVIGGLKLAKKLMSGEKSRDNWGMIIALIVVGGSMAAGGLGLVALIARAGSGTFNQLNDADGVVKDTGTFKGDDIKGQKLNDTILTALFDESNPILNSPVLAEKVASLVG